MKLLHVDASILNEQSVSRQFTSAIAKRLTEAAPGLQVMHTGLVAGPIEHLSAGEFLAADIVFARAEGLEIGPEIRGSAIAQIEALTA